MAGLNAVIYRIDERKKKKERKEKEEKPRNARLNEVESSGRIEFCVNGRE